MSKYCTSCGKQLNDNAAFCDGCGTNQLSFLPQNTNIPSNSVQTTSEQITSEQITSENNNTPNNNTSNYQTFTPPYNDNTEDGIMSLREKANAGPTKEKKNIPVKKIIIGILCFAILAGGGVAAYLLLSDSNDGKELKKANESSISQIENNSSEDPTDSNVSSVDESSLTDDSSVDEELNKWEIRDIEVPISNVSVNKVDVNGHEREKIKSEITGTYDNLIQYYQSNYENDTSVSISEYKNQDIYTRMSDGADYYGVKNDYKIAVTNKTTKDTIASAALTEYSAVFDGAASFEFEITSDTNAAASQTECYDRLKMFVSEELADYLVYGKGNSIPEIDAGTGSMKYNGSTNIQGLTVDLVRDVQKTGEGKFKIKFSVKYNSDESAMKLYYDKTDAKVYDNAAVKITDILTNVKNADYKKSHEFFDDIMKQFVPKGKKFIDSKLENMTITELVSDTAIKDTYKFDVAVGASGTKYEDAPDIQVEISAERSKATSEITDYDVSIFSNTQYTDLDDALTDAPKQVLNEIITLIPQLKGKITEAEMSALIETNGTKQITANFLGENTIITIKSDSIEPLTYSISFEKMTDENIPTDDSSADDNLTTDSPSDNSSADNTDSSNEDSKVIKNEDLEENETPENKTTDTSKSQEKENKTDSKS